MEKYKRLLSCWHKLEHFSPAPIPKAKNIVELTRDEPWKIPIKPQSNDKKIEYTVYIGVFNSNVVASYIKSFFNDEDQDVNESNNKVCFACLKLDQKGLYLKDSFGVSTLPWALHQLEKGNLDSDSWSKSFNHIKETIFSKFAYFFNSISLDDGNKISEELTPVSFNNIKELETYLSRILGWSLTTSLQTYVKVDEVFKSKKASSDILNSFYSEDIERIISNLNSSDINSAFYKYLSGCLNIESSRIDIIKDINELKKSLTPLNIPDGCWPSKYSLSLMQQFAVNNIFSNLSDSNDTGLFSVNGPPGTGKTTLLRDLIAPIIVKRAKSLSKYKTPHEAFTKVGEIKVSNSFSPFIYSPNRDIIEGGIVVASSNNGAVENISKELPLKKEVSPYTDQVSYFKSVAENCINENNWGLVSAVLGNKQNRNDLVSKLWFNKDFEDLQKTLKNSKNTDVLEWDNIVAEFQLKLKEVENEKQRLDKHQTNYHDFLTAYSAVKELKKDVEELDIKLSSLKKRLVDQKSLHQELFGKKQNTLNELSLIKANKPNFWIYWFNRSKRQNYKQTIENLLTRFNEYSSEEKHTEDSVLNIKESINFTKQKYSATKIKLETACATFDRLNELTHQAKQELGQNYADNLFWKNIESKKSQQACPWYSETLKKLQSELFVLAMKLNEQFIIQANSKSSRISTTIAGFFEYLKGEYTPSYDEVKAMWNTFFLVIPVISSTFASIQTMFKDLKTEDLPWLFIDEAGQAVPQAAAGAIWRSKRVVVVGDPLQIEPVVSTPKALINNISGYFNLDDTNIHTELSVQTVSDRINYWGTNLNQNSKDIWIGIPLRVHRRCLNPMFNISNSIAYNNSMYSATVEPKSIDLVFDNSFIHCKGLVDGKHYVETQAEIIRDILIDQINENKGLPDVFVISPFSEVSYKLSGYLFKPLINELKKFIPEIDSTSMGYWLSSHIGTVHTFQGKQANGVIMCLGLDENSRGAASWASIKPNLLNVALTRAKYRFLAVGDKSIWLNQPFFKELGKLNLN